MILRPVSSGGGSGVSTWGGITGTLSDQTDLQNELDAKLNPPIKKKFTATAGQTVFTADSTPIDDGYIVFRNGILQEEGNKYTRTGRDFTFATGLVLGEKVELWMFAAGTSAVNKVNAYSAETTGRTLTDTDQVVECSTGSFTITLPTAVGRTGREFKIINTGTGTITVAAAGGELICGESTIDLYQWDSIIIISNGTGWIIL